MVRAKLALRPANCVNDICLSLVDRQVSAPKFAAVAVVQEGNIASGVYKLLPISADTNIKPSYSPHEFKDFANFLVFDFAAEVFLLQSGQSNTSLSSY